jgi:hypothetical protein
MAASSLSKPAPTHAKIDGCILQEKSENFERAPEDMSAKQIQNPQPQKKANKTTAEYIEALLQ